MAHNDGPTPPIWLLPDPPARTRTLGRPEIVHAAIEIADAGGVEALNMRAIAAKLGSSTPMSLYRYVHNKDGLVDLMLDSAQGELDVPAQPGPDWRADLRELALATWHMAGRHPWFAMLVPSRPPAGPHARRRTEFVLAVFDRLGKNLATAMTYLRLLDSHVYGHALQAVEERKMWQRNNFSSVDQPSELMRSWLPDGGIEAIRAEYPQLARLIDAMITGADIGTATTLDGQFELGIDCLLDGIAARM